MPSMPIDSPPDFSCVTVGQGPPLVAFPGMARTPVKKGSHYLGLAHATQRTIHVINHPSGLPRGLTMPDLAARHAKIIAERFTHPIDLLGVSTGGAIALQLAVDHPTLIDRLIIVAAASWLGDEGREKLRRFGQEISQDRSGAKILASVLFPRPWSTIMIPFLWFADQLERRIDPSDMLATIDAEVGFDVRPQLHQIRIPTLLIAGACDRAFPRSLTESTAAAIPNSRLILYPRAGHIGTMMNPHFGRDVAEFLSTPHPV